MKRYTKNVELVNKKNLSLPYRYWQKLVAEAHIEWITFITFDDIFDFLRMPFEMKNSRATLMREMKKILAGLNNVVNHVDDQTAHMETGRRICKYLEVVGNELVLLK